MFSFRTWFVSRAPAPRRPADRARPARPHLEALEGRLAPAAPVIGHTHPDVHFPELVTTDVFVIGGDNQLYTAGLAFDSGGQPSAYLQVAPGQVKAITVDGPPSPPGAGARVFAIGGDDQVYESLFLAPSAVIPPTP
jgi:hypothetical protein